VVTLGFDGGRTDDATALVACGRPLTGCSSRRAVWESPGRGSGWEIDRELVSEAVARAFDGYDVVGFYADVALWESYIDAWSQEYRKHLQRQGVHPSAVGWDMRSRLQIATRGTERLVAAIRDGQVPPHGRTDPSPPRSERPQATEPLRHVLRQGVA
jgi:hypothetical protein